jgi:NADH dehydrogenase
MDQRLVTILGGTGFLGRRIVRHLQEHGFAVRIATRHPERGRLLFGSDEPRITSVQCDIHDERSTAAALAGAYAAVNAVSLYVERGSENFHSVHVDAARRVAREARAGGLARLVHLSGIGADPNSSSLYIRKRGEGELAVRDVFAEATLVRPAVMFAPDDAFLTTVIGLLRRLPIYPMFGRGRTRLQPVHAEDVAEAIARMLLSAQLRGLTFELGGPRIYSYEEFLRIVAREASLKTILVPVPFAAWSAIAGIAEILPSAPITRNQVELMQIDTVASPQMPGFADIDISPRRLEEILQRMLSNH